MGDNPAGAPMCVHDDHRPVESATEAPYCHACAVIFEMWINELTDDRPCND